VEVPTQQIDDKLDINLSSIGAAWYLMQLREARTVHASCRPELTDEQTRTASSMHWQLINFNAIRDFPGTTYHDIQS
jgi:hypothetical protein